MKIASLFFALALLAGCAAEPVATVSPSENTEKISIETATEADFVSRFDTVTEIHLSDDGIAVDGGEETEAVFISHDIIYYED